LDHSHSIDTANVRQPVEAAGLPGVKLRQHACTYTHTHTHTHTRTQHTHTHNIHIHTTHHTHNTPHTRTFYRYTSTHLHNLPFAYISRDFWKKEIGFPGEVRCLCAHTAAIFAAASSSAFCFLARMLASTRDTDSKDSE